jgi:hypothetical protein
MDDPRFTRAWKEYEARRQMFRISFIGAPFLLLFMAGYGLLLGMEDASMGVEIVVFTVAILAFVSGSRLLAFRCPGCRKPFLVKGSLPLPLTKACVRVKASPRH